MSKIELTRVPGDLNSYTELELQLPATPEGAAARIILALTLYTVDQKAGESALAGAVHPGQLAPGEGEKRLSKRSLDLIKNQIGSKPYHMHSYFTGTSPDTGYKLTDPPYSLEFSTNPHSGRAEDGRIKLFIKSSGADSPRPITLQTDASKAWKAAEWSSLLSGIRSI
jgi:hypothetical protein